MLLNYSIKIVSGTLTLPILRPSAPPPPGITIHFKGRHSASYLHLFLDNKHLFLDKYLATHHLYYAI